MARMGDRLASDWFFLEQLHISASYEFNEAMSPSVHDGSTVPVVVAERRRRPRSPELWKTTMFSLFRRKAPKTTSYTWKPALDLTDPRVSAILKTFGWA
ncbi:hypothetical protein [Pinisolibacter aquiterrae]|uniref:hypothetical protein n=1 Tax=Pinisolibacter aquiterrae TaxID=2815579 RepID=UPI001C3DC632|nr:hypothetical protein [Pinisolibacter aquiterrae]MBV5263404.1 hypothetical protein [Pinisolibacter aquiterrae]MCC8237519.1 hypothetical protein [Pinisolibacter aquiterrae]